MSKKIHIIIGAFLLLVIGKAWGQQWEFGANLGASGYMGDINPSNPFYFKNIATGLNVKYNLNPTWGLKAAINYAKLFGSDEDSPSQNQRIRNLAFNNHVLELSAVGEFNFFKFIAGRPDLRYTPYLFAGIAAVKNSPYVRIYDGTRYNLRNLYLENDYRNENHKVVSDYTVAIPFGVGFKYNLKGPWTLGIELGYRATFTDYLDNVSENYTTFEYYELPANVRSKIKEEHWYYLADPSNNLFQNAGKMRGSGKANDGYMTAGITITYTLFSQKCYWW